MTTTSVRPTLVNRSRIGWAGVACLLGGAFAITQTLFAITHVGMILGLIALRGCGAVPPGRLGRVGLLVAVSGMVVLTVNELLAIIPAGQSTGSRAAGTVGAIYGLATILMGLGMVMAGIAVLRGGVWSGWERWLPLVLGIWLFVPTMPALFTDGDVARVALAGWALLFALLGWVLWRRNPTAGPGHAQSVHQARSRVA